MFSESAKHVDEVQLTPNYLNFEHCLIREFSIIQMIENLSKSLNEKLVKMEYWTPFFFSFSFFLV